MYITTVITILAAAFLINGHSDTEQCCGKFEEESNCTTPCQEKKCIPSFDTQICTLECQNGCVCKKGFIRISDNINKCIPKCFCPFLAPFVEEQTSCYPCGKFSQYTTCGGSCPETCNPSEYAAALCSPEKNLAGCVCNPGFVKISKDIDICVPKYLCKFIAPYTGDDFELDVS